LLRLRELPEEIINKYPILKYRISNIKVGRYVRGIPDSNNDRCWLMLDDMVVSGNSYHFPCIIYLREGGNPIGKVDKDIRWQRANWVSKHKPWKDPICKSQCLDVCQEFNKKSSETHTIENLFHSV
jgi:hypothetical protein